MFVLGTPLALGRLPQQQHLRKLHRASWSAVWIWLHALQPGRCLALRRCKQQL
jgi:hypothetical protein